jgi:hypothetical protein
LRREAGDRFAEAGRREATACQEERRAKLERVAAEDALQRADEIDPELADAGLADDAAPGARPAAGPAESRRGPSE